MTTSTNITRHNFMMDTFDTDDIEIQRIRRSSHNELVQLWKREYDSANKELAKIRGDFYDLRGRYSLIKEDVVQKDIKISKLKDEVNSLRERYSDKIATIADQDLEISGLKASNATLKSKVVEQKSETQYWFKKATKLEEEGQRQRRKSKEMLKIQHEVDDEVAQRYKCKATDLEEKVGDLEIDNDLIKSRNMRLTETVKRLVGTDDFEDIVGNKKSHYQCDTHSSSVKKKAPRMSKAQKRKKSMAKVNCLLHNLEDEVRKHNIHAQEEGQKIMRKTKECENQIRVIQGCL